MNTRRAIGALMIASLALLGAACGSDSKSDASSKKTTTTVAETTTTAKPLTDEEYTVKVNEISASITAAGTDLCILTATQTPPAASTPAQVEQLVGLYTELFNAVAAALPAESAATGDALKASVTALQTEAADANYPVEFFNGDKGPAALTSEQFTQASTELQALYTAQCSPTASTTIPAG